MHPEGPGIWLETLKNFKMRNADLEYGEKT